MQGPVFCAVTHREDMGPRALLCPLSHPRPRLLWPHKAPAERLLPVPRPPGEGREEAVLCLSGGFWNDPRPIYKCRVSLLFRAGAETQPLSV